MERSGKQNLGFNTHKKGPPRCTHIGQGKVVVGFRPEMNLRMWVVFNVHDLI